MHEVGATPAFEAPPSSQRPRRRFLHRSGGRLVGELADTGRARRATGLLTAALLASGSLVGCSQGATNTSTSPSPATASPSQTPAPPEPTPVVNQDSLLIPLNTSSTLISTKDVYSVGPRSFIYGDGEGAQPMASRRTYKTVTAPVEGPSAQSDVAFSTEDPNQSISGAQVAAQMLSDAPPSFVVVASVSTPTSGLTVGSAELRAYHFAPGQPDPAKTVVIRTKDNTVENANLVGNTLVLGYDNGAKHAVGVDASTGAIRWTFDNIDVLRVEEGLVVGTVGRTFNTMTGGERGRLVALNAQTGVRAWEFGSADRIFKEFWRYLGSGYALVSVDLAGKQKGEAAQILDLASGRAVATRYGTVYPDLNGDPTNAISAAYDPETKAFLLVGGKGPSTPWGMDVISRDGATVLLTVAPEQFNALGKPRVVGAAAGRSWLARGATVDLVGTVTGKQDPLSPALVGNVTERPAYYPLFATGQFTILTSSSGNLSVYLHQNQDPVIDRIMASTTQSPTTHPPTTP